MNTQGFDSHHLRTAGSLLSFVLVCLFALLSVLIVVIGLQAYEQIIDNSETNMQQRVSLSYTANKIRAFDGVGEIETIQKGDVEALALYQNIDGEDYVTYIYCYNGFLYECFSAADVAFDPEQGENLIPMESFSAEIQGNLIRQEFVDAAGVQYIQYTALFAN